MIYHGCGDRLILIDHNLFHSPLPFLSCIILPSLAIKFYRFPARYHDADMTGTLPAHELGNAESGLILMAFRTSDADLRKKSREQ